MEYGKHIEDILSTMDFDSYQKDEEEDFDDFLELTYEKQYITGNSAKVK